MKRNWIILMAVLATIAVVIFSNRTGGSGPTPPVAPDSAVSALPDTAPKQGAMAPAFELASLDDDGMTYRVGGSRDKLLLVNFWASWCWPCQQEAPDLVKAFDKYKDRLDLYAVNATKYDKVRNAKVFVKEQGFAFPVLTDADGAVGDAYVVNNYPTSFIIDRTGKIVARIEGMTTLDHLEKILDPLINA